MAAEKALKAVKEETKAVTEVGENPTWGTEGLDAKDLLVPRLLLAQGMTERVKQKQLAEGDIYNSVTGEKLGDEKTKIEVIPISSFKTWTVMRKLKGKNRPEFEEIIPVTPENVDLPREEEQPDGSTIINNYTLNYNVLLVSEVKEGAALPHVISFQRTSLKAGKVIANQLTTLGYKKLPAAAQTLKIGAQMITNEQGTFLVFTAEKGRTSTTEEIAVAKNWYGILSKGQYKVDDAALKTEVEVESTTAGPAAF